MEADSPASAKPAADKYRCPCGYIYDPEKGDPEHGVPAGTPWEKVPDTWTCPVCHLPKSAFQKIQ
nr:MULTISPECIES: rubredoxin [Erysipelotrichaceae]